MLRAEKVATPFTAATVVVPDSVPPLGLAPSDAVTSPVNPATVLPSASRAATFTAGAIAAPATVDLGSTPNSSWTGAPAVIANAALVASGRPSATAASVYPLALLSMLSAEKLATPP